MTLIFKLETELMPETIFRKVDRFSSLSLTLCFSWKVVSSACLNYTIRSFSISLARIDLYASLKMYFSSDLRLAMQDSSW